MEGSGLVEGAQTESNELRVSHVLPVTDRVMNQAARWQFGSTESSISQPLGFMRTLVVHGCYYIHVGEAYLQRPFLATWRKTRPVLRYSYFSKRMAKIVNKIIMEIM